MVSLRAPWVLCLVVVVVGYPDHVPDSSCPWMAPKHEPYREAATTPPPYRLNIYHPRVLTNMSVPVCLVGAEPLKGFMIQAHDVDGGSLGYWRVTHPNITQVMTCTHHEDTITHTSGNNKQVVSLRWVAPLDYHGSVRFKAAIVKDYSTFWTDITSEAFTVHLV